MVANSSSRDDAEEPVLFPTLSQAEIRHKSEAERRLPTWLSQATQFSAGNLVEMGQDIELFSDYIDQDLINQIKVNLSISKLFPVQNCLVPVLAKQFRSRPFRRPNDICVSSPTGSGKTLAYIIPIVNHLKQSLARQLRAIVVLPTSDLAKQVCQSFIQVIQTTHLRVAIATGSHQDRLFVKRVSSYRADDNERKLRKTESSLIMMNQLETPVVDEYVSTIDILIATPGTLVDLIQNLPGMTLRDLEILVIDEADRLMANHKHDWLNAIDRAVCPSTFQCPCKDSNLSITNRTIDYKANYSDANGCTLSHTHESKYIHKLLFSATLSSDPQLLMHMNLFQPRLFLATKPSLTGTKIRNSLGSQASTPGASPVPIARAQGAVTVNTRSELLAATAIPEQLEEKMFITESKDKLYVMWYIMHELKFKNILCFANNRARCQELCIFLNEITSVNAITFSSDNNPEARKKYLTELQKGSADILVATDLASRGMDIDCIEYVISYDMPQSATWYAHRCGRTARADRKGTAITLVDTRQLVQFKKIVQMAHKLPNSMKLSHVVEEMKVPHFGPKDDKRELYQKTYENYQDKIRVRKARAEKFKH